MGTPHIGMGRDMSIFQIGESPYQYGVHSNLGTDICAPLVVKLLRVQPKIAFPLDPSEGLGLNLYRYVLGRGGSGQKDRKIHSKFQSYIPGIFGNMIYLPKINYSA